MLRSAQISQDASFAAQFRAAQRTPMLGDGENLKLVQRCGEAPDSQALKRLVAAYQRLVFSVANRYRNDRFSMADLVQAGNLGLLMATRKYERGKGLDFSKYAEKWIKAEIGQFVIHNKSLVRGVTTNELRKLYHALPRLKANLHPDGGSLTGGDVQAIAEKFNVGAEDVRTMEVFIQGRDAAMDAPAGAEGGASYADMLMDSRPSPEAIVIEERMGSARAHYLARAMGTLSERERIIVTGRQVEGLPLDALGERFGISRERARQIEAEALRKLRSTLEEMIDPADLLEGRPGESPAPARVKTRRRITPNVSAPAPAVAAL